MQHLMHPKPLNAPVCALAPGHARPMGCMGMHGWLHITTRSSGLHKCIHVKSYMASMTLQQQALLLIKYWDFHDENHMLKLLANDDKIELAHLRRELMNAKNKIAKLEHMVDPVTFLASR